ncbi:MAG: class I SAM-dependent methyltransferase [Thermomicrobiales bacterium]
MALRNESTTDVSTPVVAGRAVVPFRRRTRAGRLVETALDLLVPAEQRTFATRLWDGSVLPSPRGQADWTFVVNTPAIFRQIFLHPDELALGEAFLRGDWDVEGELERVFEVAESVANYRPRPRDMFHLAPLLTLGDKHPDDGHAEEHRADLHDDRAHTMTRDKQAIHYHYDVGNDFYALWLDKEMVYSCAYFATGTEDIDTAQQAKLDHICRKLRLQPGERFLDVGCGWGALVRHAVKHYGVSAVGITLSEEQAKLARERSAAEGLADRCQIELRDYRDLPTSWFDKAASVGMAEHVGTANLATYFGSVFRALRPGGLFLNHAIALRPQVHGRTDSMLGRRNHHSFIDKYVFPDGELQAIHRSLEFAEQAGFEVCDVETLRRHYALTLRQWVRRLEARHAEAVAAADETTYRIWRLYMSGAAHNFQVDRLGLYQSLLSRPETDGGCALPLTRADLYREA